MRDIYKTTFQAADDGSGNGGSTNPPKAKIKNKGKTIRRIVAGFFCALVLGGATWGAIGFKNYKDVNPNATIGTFITDVFDGGGLNGGHVIDGNVFEHLTTEHQFQGSTKAEYNAYKNEMDSIIAKRYFDVNFNCPADFNAYDIEFMTIEDNYLYLHMSACNDDAGEARLDKSTMYKTVVKYQLSPEELTELKEVIRNTDFDIIRYVDCIAQNRTASEVSSIKVTRQSNFVVNHYTKQIIENNPRSVGNHLSGDTFSILSVNDNDKTAKVLWASSTSGTYTTFTINLKEDRFEKQGDVYTGLYSATTSQNVDTTETYANMDMSAIFTHSEKPDVIDINLNP